MSKSWPKSRCCRRLLLTLSVLGRDFSMSWSELRQTTTTTTTTTMNLFGLQAQPEAGQARMNFNDLANLLDNDGNLQNEMMVASFAATMLATIPVLLGNEFDVNVGLKKKRSAEEEENEPNFSPQRRTSTKFLRWNSGVSVQSVVVTWRASPCYVGIQFFQWIVSVN